MHDDLKRRLRNEVDADLGTRPPSDLSDVLRRGRGKRVGIRLMAALSMVLVGTTVVAGGLWIDRTISSPSEDGRSSIQPADDEASPSQPTPRETPENAEGSGRPAGIFADVGGWIAFGDRRGIWAVDPTRPGDPADLVQLSSTPGVPRAWSPDGSKLLVLRDVQDSDPGGFNEWDLFVLNSDGTETRLTDADAYVTGGSFSPDGSQVVYATPSDKTHRDSFVWVIDARGGDPRPLYRSDDHLADPTFSPDGRSIAYFEGGGDHSNLLRVMNADGSGSRILLEQEFGHTRGLRWSPDGSRLVFASGGIGPGGIWVVGADGTGFMEVSPVEFEGADPHWSPDGSLISYNTGDALSGTFDALVIARWDGTQVQEFDYGRSGPWNPR